MIQVLFSLLWYTPLSFRNAFVSRSLENRQKETWITWDLNRIQSPQLSQTAHVRRNWFSCNWFFSTFFNLLSIILLGTARMWSLFIGSSSLRLSTLMHLYFSTFTSGKCDLFNSCYFALAHVFYNTSAIFLNLILLLLILSCNLCWSSWLGFIFVSAEEIPTGHCSYCIVHCG